MGTVVLGCGHTQPVEERPPAPWAIQELWCEQCDARRMLHDFRPNAEAQPDPEPCIECGLLFGQHTSECTGKVAETLQTIEELQAILRYHRHLSRHEHGVLTHAVALLEGAVVRT